MLKVYTSTSSASSRKVVTWLTENQIPFRQIKLNKEPLSVDELKQLLTFTNRGLEELLIRTSRSAFDELTLNQALEALTVDPTPLRRPILFDGKTLQMGYNAEDIRCFIPRGIRTVRQVEQLI